MKFMKLNLSRSGIAFYSNCFYEEKSTFIILMYVRVFYYDKIGNDYVLRVYFLRVLKYLNTKSSFLVCWHGHDVLT